MKLEKFEKNKIDNLLQITGGRYATKTTKSDGEHGDTWYGECENENTAKDKNSAGEKGDLIIAITRANIEDSENYY